MSSTLLGGAIGDALGKAFESKPANNPLLLDWGGKTFLPSEHHGLKGNQFTDDTQLSMELAQSLIQNNGFNPDDLSKRYVDWIVSGRARGYGRSTFAAIQNLISGKHWSQSGTMGSYGNGTAMRAAPIGIYYRDNLQMLIEVATIDAQITHASDEAVAGSIAIAMSAAMAINHDTDRLLNRVCEVLPESKVKTAIHGLGALVDVSVMPASALAFLGTKADVRETVASAIYCFLKFDNYQEAVVASIRAGGDTDTTAAIVGALFGAKNGMKDIPSDWVQQVEDSEKLIALDSQLYNRSGHSFFPGV